jgi:hypothetical protein
VQVRVEVVEQHPFGARGVRVPPYDGVVGDRQHLTAVQVVTVGDHRVRRDARVGGEPQEGGVELVTVRQPAL